MTAPRCGVSGCRRKPHARNLCQKHYDEQRKLRPAGRPAPTSRSAPAPANPASPPSSAAPADADGLAGKVCTVPGCPNAHHAKGYCKMHYGQLRRHGHIEDTPAVRSADAPVLTRDQRLIEIKKRHEIIKKEIASIHKALESEPDEDVGVEQ